MAKIKHTKNELKAQREALARFERFLPMLQLKKQQLQMEIQSISAAVADKEAEAQRLRDGLKSWVRLFGEPIAIEDLVMPGAKTLEQGNIAGVAIPVLKDFIVTREPYDLFETPPWVDDAVDAMAGLIRLRVERETLEEQRRLVQEELRITTQRVNLFEKVKIPECRDNIRTIRIFLGDEQTAGVVRGKIAKRRSAAAVVL